jgi:hypothetical protein
MLKKGECNYLDGMIMSVKKWLEGFVEKARDWRWKGASEVVWCGLAPAGRVLSSFASS